MKEVKTKDYMISASVSCMDLCNLEKAVHQVEASEVSFFHYDMVDGQFNQCFILAETMLAQMSQITTIPIEAHLAAFQPEKYINMYVKAGADYIAVHYEAMENPKATFEKIRKAGAIPILAYKSTTAPGDDFVDLAKEVPWILKLTVEPGFAGQKMQSQAVEHIKMMRKAIDENQLNTKIQADGNMNENTIPMVTKAGADIITGGTSGLFLKGKSIKECCEHMLEVVKKKG